MQGSLIFLRSKRHRLSPKDLEEEWYTEIYPLIVPALTVKLPSPIGLRSLESRQGAVSGMPRRLACILGSPVRSDKWGPLGALPSLKIIIRQRINEILTIKLRITRCRLLSFA
jgi:hypothetical protein